MNSTKGFRESPDNLKVFDYSLHGAAGDPALCLTSFKPGVIPLEALGPPGEQPYMILVQMITVTLPKVLFKPLDTE